MSRAESLAVWALALGLFLIYAGVFYAFPALLPDLEAGTGWSKADLALGPTLSYLVMAALTPLTGRVIDRGHGGAMIVTMPVLAALGVAALGFVQSRAQWWAVWAVLGVAQSGCLYESVFALLARRMGDHARVAITRITLVAGLSSTMTFPLGHWLGRVWGGQGAYLAFAAMTVLGTIPLNLWAMRLLRLPEVASHAGGHDASAGGGGQVGQERAGQAGHEVGVQVAAERAGQAASAVDGRAPMSPVGGDNRGAVRAAVRRPAFWGIATVFGLMWLSHGMLLTYILPLFQERGVSRQMAALAAACLGPAQLTGRLVLVLGGARVENRAATRVALAMVVLASALLWVAGAAPILVFVVVLVQGAGVGLMSIMRPMLVLEVLGRRGFGAISGAAAVTPILATAAAPVLGAFLLDRVGAGAIYFCLTLFSSMALAVAWILTHRPRLVG